MEVWVKNYKALIGRIYIARSIFWMSGIVSLMTSSQKIILEFRSFKF